MHEQIDIRSNEVGPTVSKKLEKWPTTITSNTSTFSVTPSCLSSASSLSGRSLWSLQQQILTSSANERFQVARSARLLVGEAPPTSSKFHRAAMDGYVDMLCEASRRETNAPAKEHQMLTPTLLAAQSGQLEALRILVGRGGDPERVSSNGSSALHLAAARNHLNCVSFLVNFGVNMWALDNELRTAKDLAAIEQCKEVLDYLDQVMAKHSAVSTKQVQKFKEKAKCAAEKRLKRVRKEQLKAIKKIERDERQLAKLSHQRRLLRAAHSISDIKLVGRGESMAISASTSASSSSSPAPQNALAGLIAHRLQADGLANRGPQANSAKHQAKRHGQGFLAKISKNKASPPSSDQESASFSSVSSTSGYLSSCSAKSILKSSLIKRDQTQETPALLGAKGSPSSPRPRYSDLVAVKPNDERRAGSDENHHEARPVGASGSTFALRLRAIRGVSRKVQIKKLLGTTTSGAEKQEIDPSESDGTQDDHLENARGEHRCSARQNCRNILKRTQSEPDFGQLQAECQEQLVDARYSSLSSLEDEDLPRSSLSDDEKVPRGSEAKDSTTAEIGHEHSKTSPPVPPPLPTPLQIKVNQFEEHRSKMKQQHLLTQCLSQLRMQQESINQQHAETGSSNRLSFSESDELLRHQLNAGDLPLKPSLIKHQQKHLKEAGLKNDKIPERLPQTNEFVGLPPPNENYSRRESRSQPVESAKGSPPASRESAGQECQSTVNIENFLASHGLFDLTNALRGESIDFEALLLLSESDLISIGILLGPRRKLLNAIDKHKKSHPRLSPVFGVKDTEF